MKVFIATFIYTGINYFYIKFLGLERLKLPEQFRVIKEVLEIICAAEFEDVDVGVLFCYVEERHEYIPLIFYCSYSAC